MSNIISIEDRYRFKTVRIREGTAQRISFAIGMILDEQARIDSIGIPVLDLPRIIVKLKKTKFYGIRVDGVYYSHFLKLMKLMDRLPDCSSLTEPRGSNRYVNHYRRIKERANKIKQNEAVRAYLRGGMTEEQKVFLPKNPRLFGANKDHNNATCTV